MLNRNRREFLCGMGAALTAGGAIGIASTGAASQITTEVERESADNRKTGKIYAVLSFMEDGSRYMRHVVVKEFKVTKEGQTLILSNEQLVAFSYRFEKASQLFRYAIYEKQSDMGERDVALLEVDIPEPPKFAAGERGSCAFTISRSSIEL